MIKEFIEYYKEEKRKEKEHNRLMTSVWDVGEFQDLIRKVNDNPNLKVKLAYPDGRYVELANLYKEPKFNDPYNMYIENM